MKELTFHTYDCLWVLAKGTTLLLLSRVGIYGQLRPSQASAMHRAWDRQQLYYGVVHLHVFLQPLKNQRVLPSIRQRPVWCGTVLIIVMKSFVSLDQ